LELTVRKIIPWSIPISIALIWTGWSFIVFNNAQYMPKFDDNPFAITGSFGDSFGFISSLMAAIAALGVYFSYRAQREDATLQYFERNFFALLGNFREIVKEIDVNLRETNRNDTIRFGPQLAMASGRLVSAHQGRDALKIVLLIIRSNIEPESYRDSKIVYRAYTLQHDKFVDDLGHYFRCLYHIYRLIDKKCPGSKDDYARIVRAHLSNSELCLLAYNCILGEGRHEFVRYIEKYSVLHNIHRSNLDICEKYELDFFIRSLPTNSFRFDKTKDFCYLICIRKFLSQKTYQALLKSHVNYGRQWLHFNYI
jgi:hypothetical protein